MQWHTMRKSNASQKGGEYSHSERLSWGNEQDQTCSRDSINLDGPYHNTSQRDIYGMPHKEMNLYNMSFSSSTASSSNDDEGIVRSTSNPLDIEMPNRASSITTIAYQNAMNNRIVEQLLCDGEKFNTNAYTPTFLHDVLMLPGSLSNLIGTVTTWDIERKMTPALLPGYKAHIHSSSLQPAVIHSDDQNAYVQGMLVFGLGKAARRLIHDHYRKQAKRRKVQIELELNVLVTGPGPHSVFEQKRFRPRRRALQAHVWLWSKKRGGENFLEQGEWNLEDYLLGNLGPKQTALRVEEDGKGDEDDEGWIGRKVEEVYLDGKVDDIREAVRGGTGTLDYERVKGNDFTGW